MVLGSICTGVYAADNTTIPSILLSEVVMYNTYNGTGYIGSRDNYVTFNASAKGNSDNVASVDTYKTVSGSYFNGSAWDNTSTAENYKTV